MGWKVVVFFNDERSVMCESITLFTNETGIQVGKEELEEIKVMHKDCKDNEVQSFTYKNHVIYTRYAEYLIEHLETLLSEVDKDGL